MLRRTNENPVFSGNPQDLNAFVTAILKDMTVEQLAYYSVNPAAAEAVVTPSGYVLPPSAGGDYDALAGCDTNLPMPLHISQTWDKELAEKVGEVIGNERRGQLKVSQPNTKLFAALGDVRINPLCGRYYEGYGEDPFLVGQMADYTARGINGPDPFYIKTQVNSKHFTVYACEWDRFSESDYTGVRMLQDYHIRPYIPGFEHNYLSGVMTSFGATNGIPNAVTPYLEELRKAYDYSVFSSSDLNGDSNLLLYINNGYDETYAVNRAEVAALMIRARAYSNNYSLLLYPEDYVEAVEKGILGITREDLEEQIRPQIEVWARQGYFNESQYPYTDLTADGTPRTSANVRHQEIALEAAQDGIVLLKNDHNLLPLAKSDKVLATGMMADYRFTTGFAINSPAGLENVDLTPVEALTQLADTAGGKVNYTPQLTGDYYTFKSNTTGKYIAGREDGTVYADVTAQSEATQFQMYDWVQDAYSFLDLESGRFLGTDAVKLDFDENANVVGTEHPNVIMKPDDKHELSPVWTFEADEEGNRYLRYGALVTEVFQELFTGIPFYETYVKGGKYLTADSQTTQLELGNTPAEGLTENALFTVEKIKDAGADAAAYTVDNDYAIVFVGASDFIQACEFTDRSDLELGANQIKLVKNVAAAFPGKTIVVLRYDFPVNIEAIQNDPNVGAILFSAYAGQYECYALAQVLYGEVPASGRLAGSWLKSKDTLPKLKNTEGIDPRYTVDMKQADPQQERLTYLYNGGNDVLYPFGYGLSYTDFQYTVLSTEQEADQLTFRIAVKNTGKYPGKEVVQVYARCEKSDYGSYVPDQQLVQFAKTGLLQPQEVQELTVTIPYTDLGKWDVHAGKTIVESGSYLFWFGRLPELRIKISVSGEELAELKSEEAVNLWEHVSGSKDVTGCEVSKKRTTAFAGDYVAVESSEADAFVVIPKVDLRSVIGIELMAASTNKVSSVEIYTGSLSGTPLTTISFAATEPVSYQLEGGIPVTELGYTAVRGDVSPQNLQTEDLYFVFKQAGVRVDSFKLIRKR